MELTGRKTSSPAALTALLPSCDAPGTISVIGREGATQLRKSHEWRRLVSVDPMKIHTVRLTAVVLR
ncbi:unnamed protein product [Lasius platythorax]|uniref:Uncharacterized protein n=1 Tax=Lasius platythorax TaxID=488582 RepID=A0AAV2NVV1_9HYME